MSLVAQAARPGFKSNPTLAAGDVKVSKDGGALTNLTTLPTVTPAAGPIVQVDLSGTEMTCDIATVVFQDAAGAEWDDLLLVIPTAARQIDDLTFPNVSGRGIDVDATGGVEITVDQNVNVNKWLTGTPDALSSGKVPSDVKLWLASAPDALSSGKVAADVKLWLASVPNALVAGDLPANVRAFLAGAIVAAAFGVDAIDGVALAPTATAEIVDRLLGRSIAGSADGGRTVTSALRRIRNRIAIAAGTLTTYQENDVAVDHTAAVTTAAGDPITEIDPA